VHFETISNCEAAQRQRACHKRLADRLGMAALALVPAAAEAAASSHSSASHGDISPIDNQTSAVVADFSKPHVSGMAKRTTNPLLTGTAFPSALLHDRVLFLHCSVSHCDEMRWIRRPASCVFGGLRFPAD
jgi:hypothetical protein